MLSDAQKQFYEENGYLKVENAVTAEQLTELRRITYNLIEQSRGITESNDIFELDEGHSRDTPRLTQIKLPHKQHPYFWEILSNSGVTQVLTSLLGPDTMLQTSKLNTLMFAISRDRHENFFTCLGKRCIRVAAPGQSRRHGQ